MINRIGQAGRVLEKDFFTMGSDPIVFDPIVLTP